MVSVTTFSYGKQHFLKCMTCSPMSESCLIFSYFGILPYKNRTIDVSLTKLSTSTELISMHMNVLFNINTDPTRCWPGKSIWYIVLSWQVINNWSDILVSDQLKTDIHLLKRSKRSLHVSKTIHSVVSLSVCIGFTKVHVNLLMNFKIY